MKRSLAIIGIIKKCKMHLNKAGEAVRRCKVPHQDNDALCNSGYNGVLGERL